MLRLCSLVFSLLCSPIQGFLPLSAPFPSTKVFRKLSLSFNLAWIFLELVELALCLRVFIELVWILNLV